MGTRWRGRAVIVAIAGLFAAGCWFLPPRRYEIDGLSMAPALVPGDVVSSGWLPRADRLFPLRRFDRWLVFAPDDQPAIKRLAGLPGETVAIAHGDLVIDGETVLTPPHVLAELASTAGECVAAAGPWQRVFSPGEVYDDAAFAPHESRRLLPVRDVGVAAVIADTGSEPVDAAIRVGSRAVRWHLPAPGRYALVTGRLDARLVAAAWPLPAGSSPHADRSSLPPHPPREWQVAEPWPSSDAAVPQLGIRLARAGAALPEHETARLLRSCTVWRDIHHRPPADGTAHWQLGAAVVFVVGDFPSGSRDSRHWGPLPVSDLQFRLLPR